MKNLMVLAVAVFASLFILAAPTAVSAAPGDFAAEACSGAKNATGSDCQGASFLNSLKKIVDVVFFIIGAAAVVMIIIGGFRYVVSGGDSAGVESAKNTILYAVIGLIVALLSYAIVNFVIKTLGTSNSATTGVTPVPSGPPSPPSSTPTPSAPAPTSTGTP